MTGRPGPCWLNIPIDVQASQIDPATLPAYDPAEDAPPYELDRLPDKYRAVLVLCDLEGKTRKEVAQQLGWPAIALGEFACGSIGVEREQQARAEA